VGFLDNCGGKELQRCWDPFNVGEAKVAKVQLDPRTMLPPPQPIINYPGNMAINANQQEATFNNIAPYSNSSTYNNLEGNGPLYSQPTTINNGYNNKIFVTDNPPSYDEATRENIIDGY